DYTNITAPNDGRIGMRLIDPGNIVHAADTASIATLTLTRPCAVLFTLPARALEDVRAAMARGPLEVVAYDADNARALSTGKLLLVAMPIAKPTATLGPKAIFQNEADRLWPGQFVNARVLLATRPNVVVIPPTAVQRGPDGAFTWVVTERQTVEPHPIEVASATKEMAIVASGLQAGELVVTGGQYKLKRDAEGMATAPLTANAGHCSMNLSEPFIRRPIATALVMASLAFVGITAYPLLPVAPLPQVDFPTIQVTATFQGASAEIMASSVAAPLERQFAQISGVTQLTSLSALGATTITIQFDLNRNIDSAGQDVQAAITAASKTLPQGMTAPPSYKKVNPADSPVLLLSARSETIPLTAVDDYGDLFLAQQISQVSGVAQVSIFGDRVPSIRVQVDPAKLAATGLTLEEIRGMLVASTSNAAKGTLNTDKLSFTIAANDQITEADQFEDVVLAYRNGAAVRVRDVGHAIADAADRNV